MRYKIHDYKILKNVSFKQAPIGRIFGNNLTMLSDNDKIIQIE